MGRSTSAVVDALGLFSFFFFFVFASAVSVCRQLPVQRSEFDMSRLQLLNANADKSVLSTDEAKAVASHLMANVPQVMVGCMHYCRDKW